MEEYTIQELSELSGVPRRTIHFYTQQGILSPPQSAGLGARYSSLHLLRLQAVPMLRAQGLRLDEIRERLSGLDLEATRALLASAPETPPPQPAAAVLSEVPPIWSRAPSIGRPEHPNGPDPSIPPVQSYLHYSLPAGLELIAPANLNPETQRGLLRLLQEAKRILGTELNQEEHKGHEEKSTKTSDEQ
ncbi:MAG TPA: MerR family transcriptional regulator [Anaerolineaceae bacterium]|nr:MerR family transcriptional regulator [Anaerolineaceae bacterium]